MTIHSKAIEQCFTVLCFNFTQFVILKNVSVLDLALSGVKGFNGCSHTYVRASLSPSASWYWGTELTAWTLPRITAENVSQKEHNEQRTGSTQRNKD